MECTWHDGPYMAPCTLYMALCTLYMALCTLSGDRWDAWIELHDARRGAQATLRQLSSRLQVRGVGAAFTAWTRVAAARKEYLLHTSIEEHVAHADRLERDVERLQAWNPHT